MRAHLLFDDVLVADCHVNHEGRFPGSGGGRGGMQRMLYWQLVRTVTLGTALRDIEKHLLEPKVKWKLAEGKLLSSFD